MPKLGLGITLAAVLAAMPALAQQAATNAAGDETSHGIYEYFGQGTSGDSVPFVGSTTDDAGKSAVFIGRTGGGMAAAPTATEGSGSSTPPAARSTAQRPLSSEALAKAALPKQAERTTSQD